MKFKVGDRVQTYPERGSAPYSFDPCTGTVTKVGDSGTSYMVRPDNKDAKGRDWIYLDKELEKIELPQPKKTVTLSSLRHSGRL